MAKKASFRAFFKMWADRQGWVVPGIHYEICDFLEHRGRIAVLRVFRGVGKSTILAVYNAWRYYKNPEWRILHQGDQDGTAYKTSRDTKNIIIRHPLTQGMAANIKGDVAFWWVPGHNDPRNPSMQAAGILSNITSSRADEIQNDDVEVLKNVETPEAREKLRHRLSEQIHIGVPGCKTLYVGTPHTHNSLYDEQIAMGAEDLTIPLFGREKRFEDTHRALSYACEFEPDVVFSGIGKETKLLEAGNDYEYESGCVIFKEPPLATIDCYANNAWPERFDTEEMLSRRKRCQTFNYWDSQYQLHAKPIAEVRLDPDKMPVYDCEPMIGLANKSVVMWLGKTQIAGMACTWDPSSGKLKSDKSILNVTLQDIHGCRYWHRSKRLLGDIAEFDKDGKTIIGGQVDQICDEVEALNIPRIVIESNGVGEFAPVVLKAALKQRGLRCAVSAEHEASNKNARILGEIQAPLDSGKLWVLASVCGEVEEEMREWNPKVKDQPDDNLDALAKSIKQEPERIRAAASQKASTHNREWRTHGGTYDIQTDY